LYNHDYREKFEELTSFIRQTTPKPGHEVVQYWVYDIVTDGDFANRASCLDDVSLRALNTGCKKISAVATFDVDSEDDLMEKFQVFLDAGFEGAMARNRKGTYKNKRSYDLQKVKTFADQEYPVIRIEEGRGKMAGRALFVCETPEGKEFRVKMVGALDDLKAYFENPTPWIGRQLTVKFQNLSADGIPRFPVAMRFREDV
jgi:DNA ligase-1